jgi:hypothetical protein
MFSVDGIVEVTICMNNYAPLVYLVDTFEVVCAPGHSMFRFPFVFLQILVDTDWESKPVPEDTDKNDTDKGLPRLMKSGRRRRDLLSKHGGIPRRRSFQHLSLENPGWRCARGSFRTAIATFVVHPLAASGAADTQGSIGFAHTRLEWDALPDCPSGINTLAILSDQGLRSGTDGIVGPVGVIVEYINARGTVQYAALDNSVDVSDSSGASTEIAFLCVCESWWFAFLSVGLLTSARV